MIPPETIARESPEEIGAAIAAEWGEGVERLDPSDIAKIAAEGARRARGEHIRESPEVKMETTAAEREDWEYEAAHSMPLTPRYTLTLLRDIATLLAEVARLTELAEARNGIRTLPDGRRIIGNGGTDMDVEG